MKRKNKHLFVFYKKKIFRIKYHSTRGTYFILFFFPHRKVHFRISIENVTAISL